MTIRKNTFLNSLKTQKQITFVSYFLITLISCYFSQTTILSLIIGLALLTGLTLNHWKERWHLFCLMLFLFLGFLITWLINWNFSFQETINWKVQVVEIKKNYLIVRHQWNKFYLKRTELKTIGEPVLNQTLKIQGTLEKMVFSQRSYQFSWEKYFRARNLNYQISINEISALESGFLFKINRCYQQWFTHPLTQIFFLNNRDESMLLVESLNKLSLSYLLNFSGLNIYCWLWLFYKFSQWSTWKFLHRDYLKVVFDVFLLLFSATRNFPFLLTKTSLFLLIKSLLRMKKRVVNRLYLWIGCFTILIVFNQELIYSPSFLYYLVGLFLFKAHSLKGWKRKTINFLITTIFFGLVTSLITYRFYYFHEFFNLLLAPLIAFLNVFVILTFWIPQVGNVYNFLTKILIKIINSFSGFNPFYSLGFIPIFWYLLTMISFWLILTRWTNGWFGWLLIFIFSINLSLLFTHKFWFYPTGLHLLNVGNGLTGIYLESNRVFVFDAGVGSGVSKTLLRDYLNYYGIDHINYLFVSHHHQDHYNEISNLVKNGVQIDHLITKETANFEYHFQNLSLKVFNLNNNQPNENNNSLVILLLAKRMNVLWMGDLEVIGEKQLLQNQEFYQIVQTKTIDYLVLGHHGSKTSSSTELLSLVQPNRVLISGEDRGSNHFPDQIVIQRLIQLQIPYSLTSRDGDLWFN